MNSRGLPSGSVSEQNVPTPPPLGGNRVRPTRTIPCVSLRTREVLKDFFNMDPASQDDAIKSLAVLSAGSVPASSRTKYLAWPAMKWVSDPDSRTYNARKLLKEGKVALRDSNKPVNKAKTQATWELFKSKKRKNRPRTPAFVGAPMLFGTKNPFSVLSQETLEESEKESLEMEIPSKPNRPARKQRFPHSRVGVVKSKRFSDAHAYAKLESRALSQEKEIARLKNENKRLLKALEDKASVSSSQSAASNAQLKHYKDENSVLVKENYALKRRVDSLTKEVAELSAGWESDPEEANTASTSVDITEKMIDYQSISLDQREHIVKCNEDPFTDAVRRYVQSNKKGAITGSTRMTLILAGRYEPEESKFYFENPSAAKAYFTLEIYSQLIAKAEQTVPDITRIINSRNYLQSWKEAGEFIGRVPVSFLEVYATRVIDYHFNCNVVYSSTLSALITYIFVCNAKQKFREPGEGGFTPHGCVWFPWGPLPFAREDETDPPLRKKTFKEGLDEYARTHPGPGCDDELYISFLKKLFSNTDNFFRLPWRDQR